MNTDIIYECGEGWFPLIERALVKMWTIDPDVYIDQVKEKFGGLRIYFTVSDFENDLLRKRLDKIVAQAEEEASYTCEVCASTTAHMVSVQGWYRTLCSDHTEN